ncbi:MAG: flagellar basal body rod protein FlgB [Clostridiales bacterium]|nr:flagellar basal body rod protein FlgB [Clostridiales bacterium]
MISSNAYSYINVLTKAADASWTRNEVLSNNLANVSTPNYKRKDVTFESYLLSELAGSSNSSLRQKVNNADVSNLGASVYTDFSTLSYRLDGNNVDIDTENVELASNQIKYNAILDSIGYEFDMLRAAMQTS